MRQPRPGAARRPSRAAAPTGPPPSDLELGSLTHWLLRTYQVRPSKGLAQNFLISERALRAILDAAELSRDDTVLEIGPGLGVLTRELADRAGLVVAVELDRAMIPVLQQVLAGRTNVEIVQANILDVDPAAIVHERPYQVVANLPYYITSLALRRLLEARRRPSRLVVMVQKEVARRIVAQPGQLSLLGLSVPVYGAPRIVTVVPATAFYPPPKVDSAVVRVDVFDRPAVDVDLEKFFRVVHAGFVHPRKQLQNGLARTLWMPKDTAPGILESAGIDPMRRPQTLSLDEWAALTRTLEAHGLV